MSRGKPGEIWLQKLVLTPCALTQLLRDSEGTIQATAQQLEFKYFVTCLVRNEIFIATYMLPAHKPIQSEQVQLLCVQWRKLWLTVVCRLLSEAK